LHAAQLVIHETAFYANTSGVGKKSHIGHPPLLFTHQAQKGLGVRGCVGKKSYIS